MIARRILLVVVLALAVGAATVAWSRKPKDDDGHHHPTTTTTRTTTTRTTTTHTTRTTTTRTTTTRTSTTRRGTTTTRTQPTFTLPTLVSTTTTRTTTSFPPTTTTTPSGSTPLCNGGALISHAVLKIRTVSARATGGVLVLSGRLPLLQVEGPIDPTATGVQVEVAAADRAVAAPPLAAFTAASGSPVPPGARGDGCNPTDGWKAGVYRNVSGRLDPPACDADARGLLAVRIRDRRARGFGVGFQVQVERVSLPPPGVPLQATIVLGGPDAGIAGLCGERTFDPLGCVRRRTGWICH